MNVSATTNPERLRAAFGTQSEEPDAVPSAREFPSHTPEENLLAWALYEASSWVGYIFPWMGLRESLTLFIGALAGVWFIGDAGVGLVKRYRT